MAVKIRGHTINDVLARHKKACEEFAKLSPEEQAKRHKEADEIIAKLRGPGFVAVRTTRGE